MSRYMDELRDKTSTLVDALDRINTIIWDLENEKDETLKYLRDDLRDILVNYSEKAEKWQEEIDEDDKEEWDAEMKEREREIYM